MENGRAVEPRRADRCARRRRAVEAVRRCERVHVLARRQQGRVRRARQRQVRAVVDELRSVRGERRGRRAAQPHRRQSGVGRAAGVLAATAACWRGARWSARASRPIASTSWSLDLKTRRAPRADAGLGSLGRTRSRSRRTARTLYAVADHFGQHPLWAIDVKTGKPTMLTGPGHVDAFAVGEREIVFAVSSLKSPAELYALTLKGGELRELPRMNAEALAQLQIGEPEQFTLRRRERRDRVRLRDAARRTSIRKRRYPVAFIVHGGPQIVVRRTRGAIAGIRRRTPAPATPRSSSTSTARPATARRSPIRSAATGAASRSRICRRVCGGARRNIRGWTASACARSALRTAAT